MRSRCLLVLWISLGACADQMSPLAALDVGVWWSPDGGADASWDAADVGPVEDVGPDVGVSPTAVTCAPGPLALTILDPGDDLALGGLAWSGGTYTLLYRTLGLPALRVDGALPIDYGLTPDVHDSWRGFDPSALSATPSGWWTAGSVNGLPAAWHYSPTADASQAAILPGGELMGAAAGSRNRFLLVAHGVQVGLARMGEADEEEQVLGERHPDDRWSLSWHIGDSGEEGVACGAVQSIGARSLALFEIDGDGTFVSHKLPQMLASGGVACRVAIGEGVRIVAFAQEGSGAKLIWVDASGHVVAGPIPFHAALTDPWRFDVAAVGGAGVLVFSDGASDVPQIVARIYPTPGESPVAVDLGVGIDLGLTVPTRVRIAAGSADLFWVAFDTASDGQRAIRVRTIGCEPVRR